MVENMVEYRMRKATILGVLLWLPGEFFRMVLAFVSIS